jgi:hypothetical protein
MTYPKAIVISAVLIAAAIAFAAYQPAQSALGSGGRYMLGGSFADGGGLSTWVIDTETGEVRLCAIGKNTTGCGSPQKKW